MKFTKQNLEQMKNNTTSELTQDVIDFILNEYDNYDDPKKIVTNLLEHGCQSGMVGYLIYYNQNLLAWFGFEETMRKVAREFEELEELV